MNDQQKIKAIETSYAGCRFRSRLEARWAVFFDTLGIAWEYEAQGFDLPVTGRYLPDFWLPENEVWVEVKGAKPTAAEQAKIIELGYVVSKQGHRVRLLQGDIPRELAQAPIGPHTYEIPEGCFGLEGTPKQLAHSPLSKPLAGKGPFLKSETGQVYLIRLRPGDKPVAARTLNSGLKVLAAGHRIAMNPWRTVPGIAVFNPMPQYMLVNTGPGSQDEHGLVHPKSGEATFFPRGLPVEPEDKLENWGLTPSVWLPLGPDDGETILAALKAARSARFEHGQSGGPERWGR